MKDCPDCHEIMEEHHDVSFDETQSIVMYECPICHKEIKVINPR